jgi:hypothetical protein
MAKITRNSLFYSESDFLFEQEIAMDYVEQDVNQVITLYRVDRTKTMVDDLYGETLSKTVIYKEPVELNVLYFIDKAKNMTYDKVQQVGNYKLVGNLKVNIFLKTLEENNVDISFGDFIGVDVTPTQTLYFEVSNDGKMDFDNSHTMFGYKPYYRTILAVPVDKNVFNGK